MAVAGPLFVVGYSRSGTKFICNLVEQASCGQVEHLGELHFFGRLAQDAAEPVKEAEVPVLLRRLANQYARRISCPYNSPGHIIECVSSYEHDRIFHRKLEVFQWFLRSIARDRGLCMVCDGTPRNAYYIAEILDAFPGARIIYMLRDPHDCVLSQKRKPSGVYKRGNLREAARLALNYNPILMARFWASSLEILEEYENDARVLKVRYETLVQQPAAALEAIANFLGYSGFEQFEGLVKRGNVSKYASKLSIGTIAAIDAIAGETMSRHGYHEHGRRLLGYLFVVLWGVRMLVTAPVVYALNMGRFSSAVHELKRRIFR